jgi:hypothetical protein
MQITIELPEEIAEGLQSKWKDPRRAALESLPVEAYRSRALTAAQLRRPLVFETPMQVDAFLKEHKIFDYSAGEFEQDRDSSGAPNERGSALRSATRGTCEEFPAALGKCLTSSSTITIEGCRRFCRTRQYWVHRHDRLFR